LVQTMKPKGHFEINWPLELDAKLPFLFKKTHQRSSLISKCYLSILSVASWKSTNIFLDYLTLS
jgi:hypothetical protein